MKANAQQKMLTMLLVEALMAQDNLFVPMPVKSKAHLNELKEQASKIMFDLAVEAGEDVTEMVARMATAGASVVPAPAEDENEDPTFEALTPDSLYELIADMKDKTLAMQLSSNEPFTASRGIAKLGFTNGVGVVVMLITSEYCYHNIQDVELPGEGPCGNPDCKNCNPSAKKGTKKADITIH